MSTRLVLVDVSRGSSPCSVARTAKSSSAMFFPVGRSHRRSTDAAFTISPTEFLSDVPTVASTDGSKIFIKVVVVVDIVSSSCVDVDVVAAEVVTLLLYVSTSFSTKRPNELPLVLPPSSTSPFFDVPSFSDDVDEFFFVADSFPSLCPFPPSFSTSSSTFPRSPSSSFDLSVDFFADSSSSSTISYMVADLIVLVDDALPSCWHRVVRHLKPTTSRSSFTNATWDG
mmetsp:Transcript_9185/g.22521  ORF Transcript_9185/g.22521 Transcript_9185/m.22521 type:complete len:227 (+) Transcript_9185:494-1174(+)